VNTKILLIALILAVAAASVNAAAPYNITAQGGNITWLVQIGLLRQTDHWQGYAGQVYFGTAAQAPADVNATGSLVNATNINFTIPCDNPTYVRGYIAFSNTSNPPAGLVAGDLTILDKLTGNKSDSGTKTFTTISTFDLPSGTIANVPTTFPYINESAQNFTFREGYFNQGNDLVFMTHIEKDLQGYNRSYFDFEAMLVAPNRTTIRYYLYADLEFECPPPTPPPGGGAGGYPGACIVFWQCDPWGPCMDDGFQYRRCWPRIACPNMTDRLKPPTVRPCRPMEPREEMPEIIPETRIFRPGFLGNLTLNLTPEKGYILEEKTMHGTFQNNNYLSAEDVTYRVTTPRIYTAFANAHPAPMVFWNTMIGGWKDHGQAEARALDWKVIPPQPIERLNPRTAEPYQFILIPPVMQPKTVDIGISAYSGPSRIKSTIAPFIVDVHPFEVAGEWRNPGVLVLYFVVDNRGNKEKDINIEVDLNRGRSTLLAELLGPLRLPADSVAIYGHEYRLGKAGLKADIIDARLYAPDMAGRETYALR
jgi:hypothetical protein